MMAARLASPKANCYFGDKIDKESLGVFSSFSALWREMYLVLAKAQTKKDQSRKEERTNRDGLH